MVHAAYHATSAWEKRRAREENGSGSWINVLEGNFPVRICSFTSSQTRHVGSVFDEGALSFNPHTHRESVLSERSATTPTRTPRVTTASSKPRTKNSQRTGRGRTSASDISPMRTIRWARRMRRRRKRRPSQQQRLVFTDCHPNRDPNLVTPLSCDTTRFATRARCSLTCVGGGQTKGMGKGRRHGAAALGMGKVRRRDGDDKRSQRGRSTPKKRSGAGEGPKHKKPRAETGRHAMRATAHAQKS